MWNGSGERLWGTNTRRDWCWGWGWSIDKMKARLSWIIILYYQTKKTDDDLGNPVLVTNDEVTSGSFNQMLYEVEGMQRITAYWRLFQCRMKPLLKQWSRHSTDHWVNRWNHAVCRETSSSWLVGWNNVWHRGALVRGLKWALEVFVSDIPSWE